MTSNAPGGDGVLGSLRSADGKGVVRIRDRYDTDIDNVWSAITDPGRLACWYGQVEATFKPGESSGYTWKPTAGGARDGLRSASPRVDSK